MTDLHLASGARWLSAEGLGPSAASIRGRRIWEADEASQALWQDHYDPEKFTEVQRRGGSL